jgi:hypothetical protein
VVVGAATIANVTDVVAVPDVAPVPVTVIVADEEADGVPEMTPVVVFNDNPAGNVPLDTAYVTAPWKKFAESAVEEVIAVPAVPEIV